MVILPIKKKWFDMILSMEKKEEYRAIEYWSKRLLPDCHQIIRINNGYGNNVPYMYLLIDKVLVGYGKKEWGAPENEKILILPIIQIIETGNIRKVI